MKIGSTIFSFFFFFFQIRRQMHKEENHAKVQSQKAGKQKT